VTVAILCSGQGPQRREIFALTGAAPQAAALFDRAARLLDGRDPRRMVQTETDEVLHRDREGQVLCTLQALAARAALADALPDRLMVAGYSVGEVAAWSIAGLVEAATAIDLVARRAEIMDAHSLPGDGLLFIRGLPCDVVENLCRRHDAAIAIVNPGNAYVIGAAGAQLQRLLEEAKAMGATGTLIPVSVASHTPRLTAASVEFRDVLAHTSMARAPKPSVRLFSGVDGTPVVNVAAGLDKLARQVSHTVHWAACLEGCVEAGASAFFELGPGRALSEMARGAYPNIPSRSLEDFRTLEGAQAWLSRAINPA
jgi:[acyl-carrier-protein] S-malonyltransferase